jgi:glycosyltransferase involved in cell wall biosynthesis
MKIGLVAPPFIAIPPPQYGGTELFIGHLASGLAARGVEVVLYTNGESKLPGVDVRWLYPKSQWPLDGEIFGNLKDLNHSAWAVRDAAAECEVIHVNNAPGISHSRFVHEPFVYTIHHPLEPALLDFYQQYPAINYVCISRFQCDQHQLAKSRTIHHGIDLDLYRLRETKKKYLTFLGRIAPIKGTHIAIEVAKRTGIPLKIAGEIQPMFEDYFNAEIKPHIDGKFIEYIGEADLDSKNELLGDSLALLFPISWDEPFGLVMPEAMACGTPVLAFPGGSVPELVSNGVSGYVCGSTEAMAARATQIADGQGIAPLVVRKYAEEYFSVDRMVSQYLALYGELLHGELLDKNQTESASPKAEKKEIAAPKVAAA